MHVKLHTDIVRITKTIVFGQFGHMGSISFGVYSGYLSEGIVQTISKLGLIKVLADWQEDLMNKSDYAENVKEHQMYFLWKLKKRAQSI